MKNLEKETFEVQTISTGSFRDVVAGKSYIVEATTLRLNHVALNAWILSECHNTRDCYEDGEAGDAEWQAHRAERERRRETWRAQVLEVLGIDPAEEGITITQALSEVFTAVHISEAAQQ